MSSCSESIGNPFELPSDDMEKVAVASGNSDAMAKTRTLSWAFADHHDRQLTWLTFIDKPPSESAGLNLVEDFYKFLISWKEIEEDVITPFIHEAMELYLEECSESLSVIAAMERSSTDLATGEDFGGNMYLPFATSRKQSQILTELREMSLVSEWRRNPFEPPSDDMEKVVEASGHCDAMTKTRTISRAIAYDDVRELIRLKKSIDKHKPSWALADHYDFRSCLKYFLDGQSFKPAQPTYVQTLNKLLNPCKEVKQVGLTPFDHVFQETSTMPCFSRHLTPLHAAVNDGHEALKLLFEESSDSEYLRVNAAMERSITDYGGNMDMHLATSRKQFQAISWGLESRVDPFEPPSDMEKVVEASGHCDAMTKKALADTLWQLRRSTELIAGTPRKLSLLTLQEVLIKFLNPSYQKKKILNPREEVIKLLFEECSESPRVIAAMKRSSSTDLATGKDCGGNTDLHLATSKKQFQSCANVDTEIDRMLRQAGALRAKDLAGHDTKDDAAVYNCRERCFHKQSHDTINAIFKPGREYACSVLLLMATLVATITYQAAFSRLGSGTIKEGYAYDYDTNGILLLRKPDSIITQSFILFNSTGFVASVAMMIFLLHEFPMKPWPQITVSTLFGSYMCSIMAVSLREAMALFFLAVPFLLLAAAGKWLGFAKQRSY